MQEFPCLEEKGFILRRSLGLEVVWMSNSPEAQEYKGCMPRIIFCFGLSRRKDLAGLRNIYLLFSLHWNKHFLGLELLATTVGLPILFCNT